MSSLSQPTNVNGIKADPKFLRDPSALESISSAIYELSSYVAYSLPTSLTSLRKTPVNSINDYQSSINYHKGQLSHQFTGDVDSVPDGLFEKKKDVIVYAAFDEILTCSNDAYKSAKNQSVLFLGYPDGFQIWDISSADNIHELISIRDEENLGQVICIKPIPNSRHIPKDALDKYAEVRPLIGLVCILTPPRENDIFPKPKSVLKFFSLKTHKIVKSMEFEDDGNIVNLNCNERVIVVSLVNPAKLHVISSSTLEPLPFSPLQDVATHPSTRVPVFALGPRLLAYATTSHPPENNGKKDGYMMNDNDEEVRATGKYRVAKDVAKEVVNGVKLLGDYGYQTLSSYFNNSNPQTSTSIKPQPTMPININNHADISHSSFSTQTSPSNGYYYNPKVGNSNGESNGIGLNGIANSFENDKENGAVGAVLIRDLGISCDEQKKQSNIIVYFSPHTNPVGYLSFSPSGTFLLSTSVQGHQFHVFEVIGKRRRGKKSLKHVYQLSRGYTNAIIGDGGVGWSDDSRWCAVASGRGTIHLFAINPYGGPAHVPSHIAGWVNNVDESYKLTTQSAVIRIKPRTPLPSDPTDVVDGALQGTNVHVNNYEYSFPSTETNTLPIDQSHHPSQLFRGHSNGLHTQYNIQHPALHNNALPSIFPNYYLRKPPGICVKFLPSMSNCSISSSNNVLLVANLHARRQIKRRPPLNLMPENASNNGKAGRRRSHSWSQNYTSSNTPNYLEFEPNNNKHDIGYQDLWSFHPAGILTLHRVWVEGVTPDQTSNQGTKDESNNSNVITIGGTPLGGNVAAVANVGRALVGSAAGVVGMGMEIAAGSVKKNPGTLDMITSYEDVAEWQLIRDATWTEVKNVIEAPKPCNTENEMAKRENDKKKWLANAEIVTYTNSKVSLPPPLWATLQFTFQTFLPGYKDAINKGEVPRSKKVEIRRDIVERIETSDESDVFNGLMKNEKGIHRNDSRTGKAVLIPAGKAIGKGTGDISANLSTAMCTSLSSSPTLSAVNIKSRERMSNGNSNGHTGSKTVDDTSATPLSFEDAHHIHIANNIPTMTSTKFTALNNKNNVLSEFSNNTTFVQYSHSSDTQSTSSSSETTYSDNAEKLDYRENNIDENEGNFFFSPDGDNEVELPTDSIILPRNR
ncbi:autophagy-related protein 18f isoform x2 [Gigaspora margarita]|uniref:Autophagy-related protein 18f isoform x2 n=1 Tax=Gigaspora margarita TaxID=4874 RepID=A0A8H3XEP1_GIGMA|nr:autophagy-related protein 18f isoform x2 [Gigaspora margarita]